MGGEVTGLGDESKFTEPQPLNREALIKAQMRDPSLAKCFASAVEKSSCSSEHPFFVENGVLMCRWSPRLDSTGEGLDNEWSVSYQVVTPVDCQ